MYWLPNGKAPAFQAGYCEFESRPVLHLINKIKGQKMEPKEIEEFRELVRPLVEYLRKNYNPHCKIIVECDHAEIVKGELGVPFEIEDD